MEYRSAFITGASSGIGAAFAKILPPAVDLLLTGTSEDRLRRVAAPLASPGRRIEWIAADLATAAGRSAVIERALTERVELFICNAGTGQAGNFLDTTLAAQRRMLAVNVLAVVELLHGLLPDMLARARQQRSRAGVIVVSSMAAFGAGPGFASYGASKALELRLTQSLAAELEDEPVDVLVLCPTFTETAFFARAGLPTPSRAMPAEAVAREALEALGRRTVHLCSLHRYPQPVRQFAAFNPALAAWRWPAQIAARLRLGKVFHHTAPRTATKLR